MAYTNPLSDIYDSLWAMMEDDTCATYLKTAGVHFTQLVPSGKRDKASATNWDFLDRKIAGDFPACAIVQTGMKYRDRGLDCLTTRMDLTYELWINTGEQPAALFWKVQFATACQWANVDAHPKALTWTTPVGKVWEVDLLDSKDTFLLTEQGRTIEGWKAVWVAVVRCEFTHASLKA